VSAASPPGSLKLNELSSLLFDTWRRGGAWDEARVDSEMLRVAQEHRDPSPVGVLREMVLDALLDLGEGQWVPHAALSAYLEDDPRIGGLERLFARWARRVGLPEPSHTQLAQRVLLESLPTLGVVDLGGADVTAASGSGELASLALRLTARGLRMIGNRMGDAAVAGEFTEARQLRVGTSARVAEVLEVTPFVDVRSAEARLELDVSPASVSRGLSVGIQAAEMRKRLSVLSELPADLESALEQAGAVIGRATFTGAAGFLWVSDPEVRHMLMNAPTLADLFVDPSPPGGLIVSPQADAERLVRRCRAMGVEISLEDGAVRVRHSTAPPPKKSDTRKLVSWRPPKRGRGA
jgi:hypothetical protein